MERRRYLGTIATVATIGVAGCGAPNGSDDDEVPEDVEQVETATPEEETPTPTPTDGGEEGLTVRMETEGEQYYFDPIGLFVESGETVTFRNEVGSHSSTAYHEENDVAEVTRIPEDAEPWDSGTLTEEGTTFEQTFEASGTYDYFCVPHKSLEMVGRIVVDEPGGPAEGTMPPDGEVPESETIVDEGAVAHDDFHE